MAELKPFLDPERPFLFTFNDSLVKVNLLFLTLFVVLFALFGIWMFPQRDVVFVLCCLQQLNFVIQADQEDLLVLSFFAHQVCMELDFAQARFNGFQEI